MRLLYCNLMSFKKRRDRRGYAVLGGFSKGNALLFIVLFPSDCKRCADGKDSAHKCQDNLKSKVL